jgi:hypothetical protein
MFSNVLIEVKKDFRDIRSHYWKHDYFYVFQRLCVITGKNYIFIPYLLYNVGITIYDFDFLYRHLIHGSISLNFFLMLANFSMVWMYLSMLVVYWGDLNCFRNGFQILFSAIQLLTIDYVFLCFQGEKEGILQIEDDFHDLSKPGLNEAIHTTTVCSDSFMFWNMLNIFLSAYILTKSTFRVLWYESFSLKDFLIQFSVSVLTLTLFGLYPISHFSKSENSIQLRNLCYRWITKNRDHAVVPENDPEEVLERLTLRESHRTDFVP